MRAVVEVRIAFELEDGTPDLVEELKEVVAAHAFDLGWPRPRFVTAEGWMYDEMTKPVMRKLTSDPVVPIVRYPKRKL